MAIILLPSRHLLNTRFQENYLFSHLRTPLDRLPIVGPRTCQGALDEIVFAITSANQSHSRYNPIPLEVRAVGVDRFARPLRESLAIRSRIIPIPHYGPTPRFAEFLLKEITEATDGELLLTPQNALILTSTPEVIDQFLALGFGILQGELTSRTPSAYSAPTPIEVLRSVIDAGPNWSQSPAIREALSPATLSLWQDFPEVLPRARRLYRDPLLTEQGSLTAMRNYSTYALGMSHRAILDLKYNDIRHAIVPGRIADEGCADGALLVPIARDFPDSDLLGIEITGEFMARCQERQRAMEYGGTYIHFHQRNITEPVFQPDSIDSTICNSTTHELWSYGHQQKTLRAYLAEKFRQTRKGGRLIIRDVVGPDAKDAPILLWCNDQDGRNDDIFAPHPTASALQAHLNTLSTAARFQRFAVDFLAGQRASGNRLPSTQLAYAPLTRANRRYFQLSLGSAMEFILKKDYTDNWTSELNEEFAFWSFSQWKSALTEAGFHILEDPHDPARASRAYTNPWMVQNRFQNKVELYSPTTLGQLPYPVTNMVLIGEK